MVQVDKNMLFLKFSALQDIHSPIQDTLGPTQQPAQRAACAADDKQVICNDQYSQNGYRVPCDIPGRWVAFLFKIQVFQETERKEQQFDHYKAIVAIVIKETCNDGISLITQFVLNGKDGR